ncbi:hypothetical protein TRICI_005764 [Trichomonascus ciferrii]|uniref:Kinase n=1 Tax=Trichomonascus ciferrii TaxID=44093 RepID=A0A642UW94_9ASCO|nr:hypothetical protein TRICI_005764 [Trichomonascus ciferrii]
MYRAAIQAAGHEGVLESANGELFIKPKTNQQELDFYNDISSRPDLEDMQLITPLFMGTLTEQEAQTEEGKVKDYDMLMEQVGVKEGKIKELVKPSSENVESGSVSLVLQNMMHGFREPNVIDIKLGSVLWDDSASEEKRERLDEVSRTTTSGSLSLRIAGMNLYDPKTKERTFYDKTFGRSIETSRVVDGFKTYFPASMEEEKARALCEGITEELKYILQTMERMEVRMKSASIMIIYEADPEAFDEKLEKGNAAVENTNRKTEQGEEEDSEDEDNHVQPLYIVKLIDFARSKYTPRQGHDENSLTGIRNLIDIFQKLEHIYSE